MATSAEEAKKQVLGDAHFGDHSMLVYRDLDALREMYCAYCKAHLEPASEIVLIATQYETPDRVRQNLMDYGIDAEKYGRDGSLVIVDSVKGYQQGDMNGVLKLAKSLARRAEKEGKRGMCVFGDPGSFFMFDRLAELLHYELSLPQSFDVKIKGFCSYHAADFDRLTPDQKQAVEGNHCRKIVA
jgi:hypothetical protein